jgi:hypothetical protein
MYLICLAVEFCKVDAANLATGGNVDAAKRESYAVVSLER